MALQKAWYDAQGFYDAFSPSFPFQEDCEAWVHGTDIISQIRLTTDCGTKCHLLAHSRRITAVNACGSLTPSKFEEGLPIGQVSVIIRRDKKPGVWQTDLQEGRNS